MFDEFNKKLFHGLMISDKVYAYSAIPFCFTASRVDSKNTARASLTGTFSTPVCSNLHTAVLRMSECHCSLAEPAMSDAVSVTVIKS